MKQNKTLPLGLLAIVLFIYAFVVYNYLVFRVDGSLSDGDSARITRSITAADEANTVVHAPSAYGNGMTYTSFSVFVHKITGIPIGDLQIFVLPSVAAFLPIIVFVSYRSLTNNVVIALLSTLLLYFQGDFLFVTWRGSHEKLTWALSLLLLLLLSKTFVTRRNLSNFQLYMTVFYVILLALVSTNTFLASSFVLSIVISFAFGIVVISMKFMKFPEVVYDNIRHLRRLMYISASAFILLYLFLFYLYPPALSSLRAFSALVDQVAVLFLSVEEQEQFSVYGYVNATWGSSNVFLALTAFSWFILITSALAWCYGVYWVLRNKDLSVEDTPRIFLWLLYPAYNLQLLITVIADRTDILGGNLQVRLFTPLLVISIPVAVTGLWYIWQRLNIRIIQVPVAFATLIAIPFFSTTAIIKASNEPLLSNQYTFFIDSEIAAFEWLEASSVRTAVIWFGIDSRPSGYIGEQIVVEEPLLDTVRYGSFPSLWVRYYILSELERARWLRAGGILFDFDRQNIVYDNGGTQVYHEPPTTAYRR